MNLTKKVCVKYGQTDDVEKKFLPFDEVVELAKKVVAEPEHTGNYHDFVELCKLYDKNEKFGLAPSEPHAAAALGLLRLLLQYEVGAMSASSSASSSSVCGGLEVLESGCQ